MAEWVHCNKCMQRCRSKLQFFLNECGHVMCEKCHGITVNNNDRCILCGKLAKSLLLSGDIPYEVQCYFKRFVTSIDALKQIYEFQHKNEMSIAKDMSNKYNYAKQEVVKSFKIIQELKKENQRLHTMLSNMPRSSLITRATSTPMTNECGPSPINSVLSSVKKNCSFKFMASPNMELSVNDSFKRPGYAQRAPFRKENSMETVNKPSPASSVRVVPGVRRFMMPSVHGPQRPFRNFPLQLLRGEKRPA